MGHEPNRQRRRQRDEDRQAEPRAWSGQALAGAGVPQDPGRQRDQQQRRRQLGVEAAGGERTDQRPPADAAPLHRAPQRPGQGGPERHLGDVVIELRRRPGIEGDAGEKQGAGGGAARARQVAPEQEGEDEGRSNKELRDEIGRPADRAGQEAARLQRPARQRRVLVGGDHPLAAPHGALHHIERRGVVRQRGRQRPGHDLAGHQ